jgi:hypothetical protein
VTVRSRHREGFTAWPNAEGMNLRSDPPAGDRADPWKWTANGVDNAGRFRLTIGDIESVHRIRSDLRGLMGIHTFPGTFFPIHRPPRW